MTWPAVVMWLFLIAGMVSRGPLILYVGAVAGCFGTLQMVPGELVGGTNFLPGSVYTMLLVIKILSRQKLGAMIQVATDPGRLGLLFAFYLWCLLSAFVMPRLFAGQVNVIPIAAQVPWPVPLQPTAANLTQPAYLTISIFSALAAYFAASNPAFVKHWLQASAVSGLALIVTGLVDMLLWAVGQSSLLDPFRNATYGLLTDVDVFGSKRVVGMMPEASAYGGTCVGALTFLACLRPCFEPFWRDTIVPVIIVGLVGMAVLSTSSAAYAGLLAFGAAYGFNWFRRSRSQSAAVRSGLSAEAALALGAGLVFLILLVFDPAILDPLYALFNEMVLQKSQSASFEERSMWTHVGMEAFYATFGFGTGFGSARTSNWFVAELSNTGIIGTALLALFLFKVFFQAARMPKDAEIVVGLKMSVIPGLLMSLLAGTTPDVGGCMIYGLINRLADRKNKDAAQAGAAFNPQIRSRYDSAARRQV